MVRPCRSRLDPVGVGHAHAGGGAVPGEDDVARRIDLGEIGDFTIAGVELGDVLQLQFLDDVADPALAEGFPGERGDGPRAEQRPQRHFDRAGIGRRHDADAVIRRHFQHFTRQVDRKLQLGLADLRAMRTAESCVLEILGVPAGALGAGAGGEMRHGRPRSGLRYGHLLPFQIVSLPLGGGVPPRSLRESLLTVKELCGLSRAIDRNCSADSSGSADCTESNSAASTTSFAALRRLATFRTHWSSARTTYSIPCLRIE